MKSYEGCQFNGCSYIRDTGIKEYPNGAKLRVAEWKCRCGKLFEAFIWKVTTGHKKSCGCLFPERHGHKVANTRIYRTWCYIKDRCFNKSRHNYHNYGGRGIVMCAPWKGSFLEFLNYVQTTFGVTDIPKGLSIDRIDNDLGYEPGNIRLATRKQQNNNKRNNRVIWFCSQRFTITEFSEVLGIRPGTLARRLDSGKTISEMVLK